MVGCFYCENGEKLKSLMIKVYEFQKTNVFLNRDQKHLGRCVVELKDHKTEYFMMTDEEHKDFFFALSVTAEAIYDLFKPDKINYATFGDLVPHVHVHVVPKYKDGLQWGVPFDDSVPKKILSDSEYADLVKRLSQKIEEICKRKEKGKK